MNRKEFLKFSALSTVGVIAGGSQVFLQSCKKSSTENPVNFTLDLTQPANAALNNIGGFIYSNSVIVIRVDASSYAALSQVCTHQGCTVAYVSSLKEVRCPCHQAAYNMSGSIISGPQPSGLKSYSVVKNGNILTVSG